MLERTASSLEARTLRRMLSKSASSARRCRQLHTGFWQHGASAIELSSLWPPPPRVAASDESQAYESPAELPISLVASVFMLDFLYPDNVRAIFRHLYPGSVRARDDIKVMKRPLGRHFACSSVAQQEPRPMSSEPRSSHIHGPREPGCPHQDPPATLSGGETCESVSFQVTDPAAPESGQRQAPTAKSNSDLERLVNLLSSTGEQSFQAAWDQYGRLCEEQRKQVRPRMVEYLSQSGSIVEMGRALSLIRKIPIEDWKDGASDAVVLVFIRMGDMDSAVAQFKRFVAVYEQSQGLHHLLEEAVSKEQWDVALDVWLAYFESHKQKHQDEEPSTAPMKQLSTIPSLPRLYFSFERDMATRNLPIQIDMETSSIAASAFAAFRRQFAKLVLEKPCSAKQAELILASFGDPRLYHRYLAVVVQQLKQKLIPRSKSAMLGPLYRKFRQFPNAQPHPRLLHDIFNWFYPEDTDGIELLYQDWIGTQGSLDYIALKQFLKYYAKRGDVKMVQNLWQQWTTKFPHLRDRVSSYWSLLNVYAQIGDLNAVERQFESLSGKDGFETDKSSRNTLLKAYVRAGQDEKAMKFFSQMREKKLADSFTYTHVLNVSARRGDVDSSLKVLQLSQQDGVKPTAGMSFSLVWTFCERDQLDAAEKICRQLTDLGLADTRSWNTLLHFHGMQGHLEKCYTLFEAMRQGGVEWDGETYEFLLQAMAVVGQTQAAYHFLEKGYEQNLFVLQPQHFAIVMRRAAASEPQRVAAFEKLMDKAGVRRTFAIDQALLQAAHKLGPHSPRTHVLRRRLIGDLRAMATSERPGQGDGHSARRDIRLLRQQNHDVGRAVMLLVESRDLETAEELVMASLELFPQQQGVETLGPDVLSALMTAYLNEGSYSSVHSLWKKVWKYVLNDCQVPEGGGIYPAHRYDLCRPMDVLVQTFRAQRDGKGLLACVQQVVSTGFALTSRLWNDIIQELSYLGKWDEAMNWCETLLMPRWRGWGTLRMTAAEKRHLRNTRLLRPSQKTVLVLQSKWLKMRQLAAWSPQVSRDLDSMRRRFPRLHHAFNQTDYLNIDGQWILEGSVDLMKSIDKWIAKLPPRDLKTVWRDLRWSLYGSQLSTDAGLRNGGMRWRQRRRHGRQQPGPMLSPYDRPVLDLGAERPRISFPRNLPPKQAEVLSGVIGEELTEQSAARLPGRRALAQMEQETRNQEATDK